MGLYLNTYGVKLDQINGVINSKDVDICAEIIDKSKKIMNFDEPFEEGITIEEAIHDIIMGYFAKIKPNVVYYFAAACISLTFKIDLPNYLSIKYSHETDIINKYLVECFSITDFDITTIIGANPDIIEIPNFLRDFDEDLYECPIIGFLSRQNLHWLKRKLKKFVYDENEVERMIKSNNEEESTKGYEIRNIKWLIDNTNYCIKNKLEMMTLCG